MIRDRPIPHDLSVATLEQRIEAERDIAALLEQRGLPEPDDVEYARTCIRLIWWDPKRALIVPIDPPPPGSMFGENLRDLDALRGRGHVGGELDEDAPNIQIDGSGHLAA